MLALEQPPLCHKTNIFSKNYLVFNIVPIQQGASLCAAVALIIFFYPVLDGIEKTELMIWQRIAMHPTE
jgi:hypothetical protein